MDRTSHSFFFLMIRRPPRSTPFPTRRSSDLPGGGVRLRCGGHAQVGALRGADDRAAKGARSEEHTSELQSQSNLVCRLLLEKKKKQINPLTCQSTSTARPAGVRRHTFS